MIFNQREFYSAAVASALLVVPFLALDLLAARGSTRTAMDRLVLFGLLWLLPLLFIAFGMAAVRTARQGKGVTAATSPIYIRIALALVLAIAWGSLLVDQWPCFMGMPNCD